ncbi:MAG: hypothetical protein AAF984_02105 [Verrucomicrobiota bacterium]
MSSKSKFFPSLVVSLVILLFLILVVLLSGWFYANHYLRSDSFLSMVSGKTSHFIKTEGKFLPFGFQGTSISSNGYVGEGIEGSAFEKVQADQITAVFDLSAMLQRICRIKTLRVQRLNLRLMGEPSSETSINSEDEAPLQKTTIASPALNPILAPLMAFLPNKFEVKEIILEEVNLSWPVKDPEVTGPKYGTLTRSEVKLYPQQGGSWKAQGHSGTVAYPGYPSLLLDYYQILIDLPRIEIADARAHVVNPGAKTPTENGDLQIQGHVITTKPLSAKLDYEMKNIDAFHILPEKWQPHLSGKIHSKGKLEFKGDSTRVSGHVEMKEALLRGFPMQNMISQVTRINDFVQLKFNQVESDFVYENNDFELMNAVLESQGLLRLEGQGKLEQEAVSGLIDVGVKPSVLTWIPGAKSQVFTLNRDGYAWASPAMQLSGTKDKIEEDLSPRLKEAFVGLLQNKAEEGIQKGAEAIEKSGDVIQDVGSSILDALGF